MKFGQEFQAALEREEFPREWVESSLSYKKLKKCIKRVQKELLDLGLDQETLNALWQHVSTGGEIAKDEHESHRMLKYQVNGSNQIAFTPKLTIALDPRDGTPMDAWLSPETRRHLRRYSTHPKHEQSESPDSALPRRRATLSKRLKREAVGSDLSSPGLETSTGSADGEPPQSPEAEHDSSSDEIETIEIPLNSDSEFFQLLRRELNSIETLQGREQKEISDQITLLAHELQTLKSSKKKKSKQEVEAWRQLFELYTDSEVFASSHEIDAGSRDVAHAQKQLQMFTKSVAEQRLKKRLATKEANEAMERFLKINVDLLRLMRFQEVNRIALAKIMKKFDKRTALHARAAIPDALTDGAVVSQDLAKATCFTIANELLSVIPQINDYLCPICFSLAYKPVNLECSHRFCILCLIVMQRQKQEHCPLCRAEVVMKANSGKWNHSIRSDCKEC